MTENFRKRIKDEMSVSYANSLEKNFDLAKAFIRITETGTVDLLEKESLKGQEKILLYLIGKRYAKESGMTDSEFVSWKELSEELGMKSGSVLPWIKSLRDQGRIESKKGKYSVKTNFIEISLKELTKKNKNGS